MLKRTRNAPESCGVYLFKTAKGKILYIGKALNLKKRIGQYFRPRPSPLLLSLLSRADRIEWILTENEKDALILESDLVHEHQPIYNIRLKDDKRFPMIEITLSEDFPGIYFARKRAKDSFTIGPLTRTKLARELLDTVSRIFKIRQCSNRAFRSGVPCLYFHIDRCSAPCAGKINAEAYRTQALGAVHFLKAEKRELIVGFLSRMKTLATAEKFEEAQKLKTDMEDIDRILSRSYLASPIEPAYDAFSFIIQKQTGFSLYLSVVHGHVRRSEYFRFDLISPEREEVIKEFLLAFYRNHPLPKKICFSAFPDNAHSLATALGFMGGHPVRICVPKRGDQRKVMQWAERNLNHHVTIVDYESLATAFASAFSLPGPPWCIEGYDVSHLAESDRIGARVTFERGIPKNRLVRNYIIHSAPAGDTEALKEILRRRFRNETQFPDLLLIDGGKPQLAAALEIKKEMRWPSAVLALAKGEERVYAESGKSRVFPIESPVRHLLMRIRDEAHCRAVSHHRLRRQKRLIKG